MNCLKLLGSSLPMFSSRNTLSHLLTGGRNFSSLLNFSCVNSNALVNINSNPLFKTNLKLTPATATEYLSKCGLKVYGKPKLRCKYCYYAGIEGVLHVFCSKYPRHKQRALIPRKRKYTWILSHACQSKYRPY